LSEIEQSALELLRFQCLTVWPLPSQLL